MLILIADFLDNLVKIAIDLYSKSKVAQTFLYGR